MLQSLTTLTVLVAVFTACEPVEKSSLTMFSGDIPNDIPLIFAPGVISTGNHHESSITFSPDMSEMYFNRRKPEERPNIYTMKLVNGHWTAPMLAPFATNKEYLDFHARMSPHGDILYFGSTRPINDASESSGLHQWLVEKDENGWGQPLPMKEPFADRYVMCMTPSKSGNLYFNSKEKEEKLEDEGIYFAHNSEGQYHRVEKMGKEINAPGKWIAHPYIAPDESYIIYDAERTSSALTKMADGRNLTV